MKVAPKKKAAKSAATKTKPQAKAQKPASSTESTAAPKRTPMDIPAAALRSAPWNPRNRITPDSVADLSASIRKDGLIQRLVVVKDGDTYIIVAGNRRFVACRAAGLDPIPCELLAVSTEQAKRLTFIENLQRQDVDPLLESDLVAMLVADGMTLAEIAAETGRGDRWVARRANLRKLSQGWRKLIGKGYRIPVDCLERAAAYPVDIQDAVAKDVREWQLRRGLHWNDVGGDFRSLCCSLEDVAFPRKDCTKCPNNSACAPLLFADENDSPKKYGRCLDRKCYDRHRAEHVEATVAKAEKDGCPVNRVPKDDDVPMYWNLSSRRDDAHPVLWVFKKYDGRLYCGWGIEKKRASGKSGSGSTSKKKLAEKQANAKRNKAIRKLAAWCAEDDHLAKLFLAYFKTGDGQIDPKTPFVVQEAFKGVDSYRVIGIKIPDKDKLAAAALFGTFEVDAAKWSRALAGAVIQYLDPGRSQCYYAEPNAMLILEMFPEAREALGEDFKDIAEASELSKLSNPKVVWTESPDDEEPDPGELEDDDQDDEEGGEV